MTCDEIAKLFGINDHCDSCHDDHEHGYEMCEVEIDGKWHEVCCLVANSPKLKDSSHDINHTESK